MKYLKSEKGYTVIEMLVVMSAIFVISGFAYANFGDDEIDAANRAASLGKIQEIASAVISYRSQIGIYPLNLQALTTTSGQFGPWLTVLPTQDPFGTTSTGINGTAGGISAYAYAYNSTGFSVWSFGKNKRDDSGGSGSLPPNLFSADDVGKKSR